jgi:hypothetical protein
MIVSPFGAGLFLIRDGRSGGLVFIDVHGSASQAVRAPGHPAREDRSILHEVVRVLGWR